MLNSSTKRNQVASATAAAPASASRAMSCHQVGLKRSAWLLRTCWNRRGSIRRAQDHRAKTASAPGGVIERVTRIEQLLLADEGRDEIDIQLLEGTMIDQQCDCFSFANGA